MLSGSDFCDDDSCGMDFSLDDSCGSEKVDDCSCGIVCISSTGWSSAKSGGGVPVGSLS